MFKEVFLLSCFFAICYAQIVFDNGNNPQDFNVAGYGGYGQDPNNGYRNGFGYGYGYRPTYGSFGGFGRYGGYGTRHYGGYGRGFRRFGGIYFG